MPGEGTGRGRNCTKDSVTWFLVLGFWPDVVGLWTRCLASLSSVSLSASFPTCSAWPVSGPVSTEAV